MAGLASRAGVPYVRSIPERRASVKGRARARTAPGAAAE